MNYQLVNDYLTSIFNNVLVIEETSLRASRFKDVSIKEMHTIDVIGSTPNATPSDISRELMVTLGTVTTSLNNLELNQKWSLALSITSTVPQTDGQSNYWRYEYRREKSDAKRFAEFVSFLGGN